MLAFGQVISNDDCMSMEGLRTNEQTSLDIHEVFAATEFGDVLAANVRYGKYKPPELSNQRWEELLGPDVNNLNHLVDTLHVTNSFITHSDRLQPDLLSPHDKAILRVSSVVHDWGEAIVTDVNYFDVTPEGKLAEQAAFAENLSGFYRAGEPEVTALITEAAETVIFNSESRLGNIFNSIERIGYLRTALCADRHVREGSAPECEENLRWLAAAVLSNDHVETLITRGPQTHATHNFLNLRHDDLSAAYQAADPAVFYNHEPIQAADTRGQELGKARLVWGIWQAVINSGMHY